MEELRIEIDFELDDVISRIIRSLPEDYFKSLSRRDQLKHLKALLTMGVCNLQEEIMLRSEDGRHIAVLARRNYPGLLADILRRLPADDSLVGAKIFTSTDHDFIIDLFEFKTDASNSGIASPDTCDVEDTIQSVAQSSGKPIELVREFVSHYHPTSQLLGSPLQMTEQFLAFLDVEHSNDIVVRCKQANVEQTRFTISAGSSKARDVFQRTAEFLAKHSLDIEQAYLHEIPRDPGSGVAVASFIVSGSWSHQLLLEQAALLLKQFLRMDQDVIHVESEGEFTNLEDAELAVATARLTCHLLHFRGHSVTLEQVYRVIKKHRDDFDQLLAHLKSRSRNGPAGPDQPVELKPTLISLQHWNNPFERNVLSTWNSISSCLTDCNYALANRRSIAMRLDERLAESLGEAERPFAVFYVFGNGFDGFHVRFRDVARGGMRLIKTRNQEHYLLESVRGFEEAYRLAAAQQLKNKDIAEGGAKATIVLKPGVDPSRAGRDFVDGLLDLIINCGGPETELLYLGPDENVSPDLINWIVARSRQRGYPYPQSIMSSKPDAGINHKEFGVTSEGVTVFLKRALSHVGIDPQNSEFTVKLTGGPDGDVAGNEIKILFREFGERVKIVAIADGTGSAMDPQGLDSQELLRLVNQQQPICMFDKNRLSAQGKVGGLVISDEIAFRNDLQFSPQTDVFIPAGGRPSTINASNWQSYFDADGRPAAKVMVEGANLFIDDVARKELSQRGVLVVKDSSANKCGVICSSLEIIAGMLVDNREFAEIKSRFVEEVLELLRELADIEAICLFNEQPRCPDLTLPELSVLVSKQILLIGDLIFDQIGSWSPADERLARDLILRYLPDCLHDKVGPELVEKIPPVYRNQLVAAILGSRVVYREGFQNLRNMRAEDLANVAIEHLRFESKTQRLMEQVAATGIKEAGQVNEILRYAVHKAQRELRKGSN